LARSIHPLLAGSFGPTPPYSLFVLPVLDNEYITSSRLKNKFEWVNGKEYKEDRELKAYSCRGKWVAEADNAFSFLDYYAKDHKLTLAQEDLKALAVGFARHIPIVSDDRGIRQVADAHGLECMGTLDLLKLMLDSGRITITKVNEVLEYLDQENDLPMGKTELRERYKLLFSGLCPI
jgi:hypothetical protein